MTDEVRKARDEHTMSAIALLVTSGYAVARSDVSISAGEGTNDGAYYVKSLVIYEVFQDVRSGVAYFLDVTDPG